MEIPNLKLQSGKWLVANCAEMKSDKNCQMVMMAPASQKEDLLNAAIDHMVRDHGHEDSANLRKQVGYHMFKEVEL